MTPARHDDPNVLPGAVEPDTKDWTWVLGETCSECGFTATGVEPTEIGAVVRELAPRWVRALNRREVRDRPRPSTWSVLEYGAHVRDVFRVMGVRLASMLAWDDPLLANWDQDAAALADRYDLQDPAIVAGQLTKAAGALADAFDGVTPEQWDRPGRRSNGSFFTVRTLGQYMLHDVVHHLHDINA